MDRALKELHAAAECVTIDDEWDRIRRVGKAVSLLKEHCLVHPVNPTGTEKASVHYGNS